MTFPPDRLEKLVARLEGSEPVTQAEVNRIAALQALDIARMGRAFVVDALQRDKELIDVLRSDE